MKDDIFNLITALLGLIVGWALFGGIIYFGAAFLYHTFDFLNNIFHLF